MNHTIGSSHPLPSQAHRAFNLILFVLLALLSICPPAIVAPLLFSTVPSTPTKFHDPMSAPAALVPVLVWLRLIISLARQYCRLSSTMKSLPTLPTLQANTIVAYVCEVKDALITIVRLVMCTGAKAGASANPSVEDLALQC